MDSTRTIPEKRVELLIELGVPLIKAVALASAVEKVLSNRCDEETARLLIENRELVFLITSPNDLDKVRRCIEYKKR